MSVIKAYPIEVNVRGLVKRAVVSIKVEQDSDIDFSYWDETEAELTRRDLDLGRVQSLWVQVTVQFSDLAGFEGSDSLGNVFVRGSNVEKDVLQTVKDHAMVSEATADLIEQVTKGRETIEQFLNPSYVETQIERNAKGPAGRGFKKESL